MTPWTAAHHALLSLTISLSLLSVESVMPSNHLVLSPPSPPNIFWILTPYQIYDLQIFLTSSRLHFHSVDQVLQYTETFHFEAQFPYFCFCCLCYPCIFESVTFVITKPPFKMSSITFQSTSLYFSKLLDRQIHAWCSNYANHKY